LLQKTTNLPMTKVTGEYEKSYICKNAIYWHYSLTF
jgi:hypothetical protein